MSTFTEFVTQIDGVRDDVAAAVAKKFSSVQDLADARKADLQAVNGVGPVLASRILEAARAEASATTTEAAEDQLPARMKSAIADAADAARPMLSVVEDVAEDVSEDGVRDADVDTELAPAIEKVATLVGTTVGWTIRIYRTITSPFQRLLHRGA